MLLCVSTRPWFLLLAAILFASTACSDKGSTQSTTQPSTQPSAASAPASQPAAASPASTAAAPAPAAAPVPSAGPVLATAQYSADPDLRCDLLEVKRVSGGALYVRWRVVNTAGQGQAGLAAAQPKSIHYDFAWDDLYYIDPSENKKYQYLKDAEGNRILDIYYGNLQPGEQRMNWAKFPAPPPTSNKVSLNLPKFPPFEDVPVAQ